VLDLHTFQPREVKDLVRIIWRVSERDPPVRIIHAKASATCGERACDTAKHPAVLSFTLDHPQFGGWGATIVQLRSCDVNPVCRRVMKRMAQPAG